MDYKSDASITCFFDTSCSTPACSQHSMQLFVSAYPLFCIWYITLIGRGSILVLTTRWSIQVVHEPGLSSNQGKGRYRAEEWKKLSRCNVIHQKAHLIIYLLCVSHPECGGCNHSNSTEPFQAATQNPVVGLDEVIFPDRHPYFPFSTATIFIMFGITSTLICPRHLGVLQGKEIMRKKLNVQ